MKKITILFFVIVSMTFNINAQFGGGSGTSSSPYIINTPEQLQRVAQPQYSTNPNLYFRLNYTSSITLQWQTIEEFRGNFDGFYNAVALDKPFINNNYGYVTRLGIILDYVGNGSNSTWTGGFGAIACNSRDGSQILRCFVAGSMTNMGKGQIGGITGTATNNSGINFCKSYVYIDSNGQDVGGVVGYFDNTGSGNRGITSCYAHGTIKGTKNVGGIVGRLEGAGYSYLSTCNTYVMVYGDENVGGLFGYAPVRTSYLLTDCYAQGIVKGKKYIGGFGGYAEYFVLQSHQYKSYSAVVVDNTEAQAGTAGLLGGYAGGFQVMRMDSVFADIEINTLKSYNQIFANKNLSGNTTNSIGLFNTRPLMNNLSRYWSLTEANPGYPKYTPTLFDEWYIITQVTVEEFLNYLDPSLLNRVVNWQCFGYPGYTTWTEVVCSGNYLNYKTCNNLFNSPPPGRNAQLNLVSDHGFEFETENTILSSVKVYPNPTTGIITVESAEENPQILVYDQNGKFIFRTTGKTLDFSFYPNGIYTLNIHGHIEKVVKK